jgi:transposase
MTAQHRTHHRCKTTSQKERLNALRWKDLRNAYLKAYRSVEKNIDHTWKKLKKDIKNHSYHSIAKRKADLSKLLNKCNSMARKQADSLSVTKSHF